MLILTQEVSTALLESYIEETIVKSQMEQIEGKSELKSIGTLHPVTSKRIYTNVPRFSFFCSYGEVVSTVALCKKSLE